MQAVSTNSHLIKRSRQEAIFLSAAMIERCTAAAGGHLQEAERKTKSIATRFELSDASMALNKHRAAIRAGYAARLDDAIGKALHNARTAESDSEAARADRIARVFGDESSFSLLEDSEVARFVEASRLQQTAMPVVDQVLARLDSLMSSAMGLPVVRADLNPLRPDILCGALIDLLESFNETAQIRGHWLRALARPFAEEMRGLYQSIVSLLEAQGVEEARYRLKLTEGGMAPPRGGTGAGGGGGTGGAGGAGGPGQADDSMPDDADLVRERRGLFPSMSDLAQARPMVPQGLIRDFLYRAQWIAENDEPLPPAYYEEATAQLAVAIRASTQAPVFDSGELARRRLRDQALAVVDRPARAVDVSTPLQPQQWGEAATAEARTRTLMELKAQATKISQALGLDAVRTLVSQVADDERVMAPVREAFVAMEPALLRLAMKDPRFFGDDHHPARRLMEGVAQRSFKYNDEYADEFEQFMAPVREAVRELNEQEDAEPAAFAQRLQQLETRWQQEDQGEKEGKDAGLRSMHFAQERQELADKIAWDFSLRSDLDRVPAVVSDFLFKDWSLVIAHAQLTDTRGQLDPGGYLAVVTDLLWSVKRNAVLKEPRRLFEVIPGVLQTLRRGLAMLGKEPHETETFFAALMRYHDPVLRLRRMRSAQDAEATGMARLETDSFLLPLEPDSEPAPLERPTPRAADQPWLGRHELAAAGFEDEADAAHRTASAPLAPAEGFGTTTLMALDGMNAGATLLPEMSPHDAAEPAASGLPSLDEALRALKSGQPPTAHDDEEAELAHQRSILERLRTGDWVDLRVRDQWRRAQLVWSSENGSLFMFVSRGGRPHSMTRRTCEKLIRSRYLRPVDAAAVVDKALRNLSDAESSRQEEPAVTG